MKWFQVDSDAPDDPKIQAVVTKFGNAGLGALFRLWCFTARHGARPGITIDSQGRPIPREFLEQAAGLNTREFSSLVAFLVEIGHCKERTLNRRTIFAFPAMSRRCDTYTTRVVRTVFEHDSNNVRDNTRQDNTNKRSKNTGAFAPVFSAKDSYRVVVKLAREIVDQTPPERRTFADLKESLKQACAKIRVPYDSTVVAKAIDAAIHVRQKKAAAR